MERITYQPGYVPIVSTRHPCVDGEGAFSIPLFATQCQAFAVFSHTPANLLRFTASQVQNALPTLHIRSLKFV